MSGENLVLVAFALLPFAIAGSTLVFFRMRARQRVAEPGALELVTGNLLIFALIASLLLPVGELYYRFVYDTTESFGFSKVGGRWFQRYFHRNVSGYRDSLEEYNLFATAGRPRVSFLGDSFTAAQGVKNVEDRFVNRVRALRGDWEVHGIAENGWHTGVELEELENITEKGYQLGDVVLVYCLNDAADLVPAWQESIQWLLANRRESWLVSNSYLINTIYYRWVASQNPRIANYYDFMLEAYSGPLWQAQRKRLRTLIGLVESKGARLRVVTFPFLNLMGRDAGDYEYAFAHQALDDFWKRQGIPHLDLLDVYASHDPDELVVNPYDAHPNEEAHEMAARAIVEFLEEADGAG